MTKSILKLGTVAALGFALSPFAASAMDFGGKKITVQVPSGSGGTYHVYCQIVQQNLGRHLAGNPQMLIQNLPGAGGAKSAAFMGNVAAKNGSILAMIAPGTITVPLWRKVKFDTRNFEWLGAPAARSSAIWVWHTHGIKTIEDAKKTEVKIATSGFASGGSVIPRMVNAYLGTKLKLIYGYKGGGAMNLAIEQGEAQGRWNFRSGFSGVRPTWLPQKKVIPLIATGPRDAQLNGVPHFRDLLAAGSVQQKAYDVLGMNFEVGQAFYLPPGTPKGTVAAFRTAFGKMLADPKTIAMIKKRGVEYSPVSAAKIQKLIASGFKAATPEVVQEIKNVYSKKKSS